MKRTVVNGTEARGRPRTNGNLKARGKFAAAKLLRQMTAKKENPLSADNRHWADQGWIMAPKK